MAAPPQSVGDPIDRHVSEGDHFHGFGGQSGNGQTEPARPLPAGVCGASQAAGTPMATQRCVAIGL